MSYIGATLKEVRDAIRTGKIRPAGVSPVKQVEQLDMRGAGTKRLTEALANRLLPRWWNGGPGTKLVVGYVHSKFNLIPLVVTRPAHVLVHSLPARNGARVTMPTIHKIFVNLLRDRIRDTNFCDIISNHRTGYLSPMHFSTLKNFRLNYDQAYSNNYATTNNNNDAYNDDDFYVATGMGDINNNWIDHVGRTGQNKRHRVRILPTIGRDGYPHIATRFFVWPAGILDNRTSNATNKIMHAIECNSQRRAAVPPVIARYVKNLRARRARKATLMAELRAVPRGVLHPSFPGGSNYVASIARLEALRRENMAPADKKLNRLDQLQPSKKQKR